MGLLDFKYQRTIRGKENLTGKIAETLRDHGSDVEESESEITVKGLSSFFASGSAVIKINDSSIRLEGKVMPSIAGIICGSISLIMDLIGLFSGCDLESVLVMALVIALGAAGTIGTLISFCVGKEVLRQQLAWQINSVEG